MKKLLAVAVLWALAAPQPALAHRHKPLDVVDRLVDAWNSHDPAAMAALWADGQTAAAVGQTAGGAGELALLSSQGDFRQTSEVSVQEVGQGVEVLDWSGEIVHPDGRVVPVHITATVVKARGVYWFVGLQSTASLR